MRRRAFLYITRDLPSGRQLLVFTQTDPAAGVQTPGGTIEPGEDLVAGALREAYEETGLEQFGEAQQIGFELFDGPDEAVECYHFHLPFLGQAPDHWTHVVSAGKDDQGMEFACFWLGLGEARQKVWPHMLYALDQLG